MRTRVTAIVLLLLTAALGGVVYTRFPGLLSFLFPPSHLSGPYPTEEAWVVNETVRDVMEMAAYPAAVAPPSVAPESGDGRYRVSIAETPVQLDLHDDLWAPERFSVVARAALGGGANRGSTPGDFPFIHPALLDFIPDAIVGASDRTTRALTSNMRDPRAHEAAALVLGAFALREAAGRFGDTRWALNRMTAHLAIARALAEMPGIDGRLADAVLLTLTNRQVRALEAIDRLEAERPSEAVGAWTRALRLRITQDWRGVLVPAALSRLEKEEYIRARRATVAGAAAVEDLQLVGAFEDAGWIRLVQNSTMGVGDGWIGTDSLDFERDEYRGVFERMQGRALAADETAAINARASRFLGPDGPRVVPWGAWAEFAQRHLAMFIDRQDRFYRKLQADARRADLEKSRLIRELRPLTMFPVASVFWTKGPRGGEADLRFLKEAIATVLKSPERITPAEWGFLEIGNRYEPVRGGIPARATWFMAASPRVPQNAGARLQDSGHRADAAAYAAVLSVAPYDYAVASGYLTTKYGAKPPFEQISAVLGSRLEYDSRVLSVVERSAPTSEDRLTVQRAACGVSANRCLSLGRELALAARDEEAAAAYERAFDDPTVDSVELSNNSAWLVSYYLRSGKRNAAMALAMRGAGTGSLRGLVTFGLLAERLGDPDAAEEAYLQAAQRYENPAALLGYYYRSVVVRKEKRREEAWKKELARVFPDGLMPVPSGGDRPTHAVTITNDSQLSRSAGLLIGDLIVGVEGYRVENLGQYRAANAFVDRDEMKLTVWRGGSLVPIAVTAPGRDVGYELRSYPVEGYAEK